jgi:hypothetical protein
MDEHPRRSFDARYLNRCSRELIPYSLEPAPFFCECDAVDCRAAVWLTVRAYDELVASGAHVLAEGHDSPELASTLLERIAVAAEPPAAVGHA